MLTLKWSRTSIVCWLNSPRCLPCLIEEAWHGQHQVKARFPNCGIPNTPLFSLYLSHSFAFPLALNYLDLESIFTANSIRLRLALCHHWMQFVQFCPTHTHTHTRPPAFATKLMCFATICQKKKDKNWKKIAKEKQRKRQAEPSFISCTCPCPMARNLCNKLCQSCLAWCGNMWLQSPLPSTFAACNLRLCLLWSRIRARCQSACGYAPCAWTVPTRHQG